MNYYEHHIGDYDQATAHLTACEDGIYSRLIRWYMASEQPLPIDIKAIQRRVRAHSREEREAVQTILNEFFELQADGYHQHRCDDEVARFQDKQRKAKASANARWNKSDRSADANADGMRTHMRTQSERNAPRARPQTPDTIPKEIQGAPTTSLEAHAQAETVALASVEGTNPTPAGLVCRAIKGTGLQGVNPGDPRLTALIAQGATQAEFVGIAAEAVAKGKGWAWVLSVLQARRADAAKIALAPAPSAPSPQAWHETPSGIRAKGESLGIPWSDDGWVNGQHMHWPTYAETVRRAAARADGAAP